MCECWALWASLVEWCDHVCELQLYSKAVGGGTRRQRTGVSLDIASFRAWQGCGLTSRLGWCLVMCRFDFPCHSRGGKLVV